jgi:hypothetical protein
MNQSQTAPGKLLLSLPPINRLRPSPTTSTTISTPLHKQRRVRAGKQGQAKEQNAHEVQGQEEVAMLVQRDGGGRDEDAGRGEERGDVGEAHEIAEGVSENAGQRLARAEEDEAFVLFVCFGRGCWFGRPGLAVDVRFCGGKETRAPANQPKTPV